MWQSSLQKRRVSGMGSSCWKFSTLKSIRAIAIMDLIDAIIFTVYRGITLTLLLAKIPPTNKSKRDMTGTTLRTSGGSGSSSAVLVNNKRMGINHTYIMGIGSHQSSLHSDAAGRDTSDEESHSVGATYMRYWSVLLLTGIVITFAVEVFLFLLLNSGAPMRNLRHCKHWFFVRVLYLLFSIGGSVINATMGDYNLISGLLEVEKIYRVGTLFIMWRFMEDMKAGDFDNSKLHYNIGATDAGGSSNAFGSYSQAP